MVFRTILFLAGRLGKANYSIVVHRDAAGGGEGGISRIWALLRGKVDILGVYPRKKPTPEKTAIHHRACGKLSVPMSTSAQTLSAQQTAPVIQQPRRHRRNGNKTAGLSEAGILAQFC